MAATPMHVSETTRVMNVVRAIVRSARTSTRALEMRFGTSAAQLVVLRALEEAPVGSVKELAQRTLTHNSSVSVVVRRLCDRGFVRRVGSEDDRRRVGYAITAEGATFLAQTPGVIEDQLSDALRRMSDIERERLGDLLCKLVESARIPLVNTARLEDA